MYVQIYLKFSVLYVHPYDPITLTVSELRLWAMLAFLSRFSPSANSVFNFQASEKCKTKLILNNYPLDIYSHKLFTHSNDSIIKCVTYA